ncbi:MAG TPA: tRNA pseudouridine(13) synthase TruD [Hyphomicrobiales bacterium]|nr:tRNA pseudouridine(13) synthase TruD [Hyphomicrobiales bacterium]
MNGVVDGAAFLLPQWPHAFGAPTLRGIARHTPADFQVREILGFDPDGRGEHLLLEVEKIDLTTPAAQQLLARAYGVHPREVAYSGLKDRRAITTQWFSLRVGMHRTATETVALPEGLRVLQAHKNSRKLRRGSHKGNRFTLVLRELEGDLDTLPPRLQQVAENGVPNYFGPQRFGHDGGNLQALQTWWAGGREPGRALRSLLLSSGRSFLFNAVLAERVAQGNWNQLLTGERLNLDSTARHFAAAAASDAELQQRLLQGDVHPTGPLYGRGESGVEEQAAALEQRVLAEHPALCAGLLREGLEHDRRALRCLVRQLHHELDGTTLCLEFELTRGAYATAVLRELVTTLEEPELETRS